MNYMNEKGNFDIGVEESKKTFCVLEGLIVTLYSKELLS